MYPDVAVSDTRWASGFGVTRMGDLARVPKYGRFSGSSLDEFPVPFSNMGCGYALDLGELAGQQPWSWRDEASRRGMGGRRPLMGAQKSRELFGTVRGVFCLMLCPWLVGVLVASALDPRMLAEC